MTVKVKETARWLKRWGPEVFFFCIAAAWCFGTLTCCVSLERRPLTRSSVALKEFLFIKPWHEPSQFSVVGVLVIIFFYGATKCSPHRRSCQKSILVSFTLKACAILYICSKAWFFNNAKDVLRNLTGDRRRVGKPIQSSWKPVAKGKKKQKKKPKTNQTWNVRMTTEAYILKKKKKLRHS